MNQLSLFDNTYPVQKPAISTKPQDKKNLVRSGYSHFSFFNDDNLDIKEIPVRITANVLHWYDRL